MIKTLLDLLILGVVLYLVYIIIGIVLSLLGISLGVIKIIAGVILILVFLREVLKRFGIDL